MRSLRLALLLAPYAAACNAPEGDPGSAWGLKLAPIVPTGQQSFAADSALTVRVTYADAPDAPVDTRLDPSSDATWQLAPVDDLDGAVVSLFLTDPDASISPLDYADLRAFGRTPPITITSGERDLPVVVAEYGKAGALGTIDAALQAVAAAVTVLPDGDVISVGGTSGVFGPAGGDFGFDHILRMSRSDEDLVFKAEGTLTSPDAGIDAARIGATADVVDTGDGPSVIVIGGRERWTPTGRAHETALLLDPTTWEVKAEPKLAVARSEHTTLRLADQSLLVFGGWDGSSQATALTWEVYRPAEEAFDFDDAWTNGSVGSIGVAWTDLGSEGVLLCGGGSTSPNLSEVLSPREGCGTIRPDLNWSTEARIGQDVAGVTVPNRMFAAMAPLPRGRVLLTGGVTQSIQAEDTAPAVAEALIYDTTTGTWEAAAPMNHPRAMHRAVALPDGRVLILGGVEAAFARSPSTVGSPIHVPEIYDPATGTFTDQPEVFALGAHPAITLPAAGSSAGWGATLVAGLRADAGGDAYGVLGLGP